MKTMSYISMAYAVAMFLAGLAASALLVHEGQFHTLIYTGILMTHALAQLFFSLRTISWSKLREYEEMGTMDNALVYGLDDEIHVLKLGNGYILLAIIASAVELYLAFISARNIRALFWWGDLDLMSIISNLIIACSIVGAPISLVYNLRTWNKRRIKS